MFGRRKRKSSHPDPIPPWLKWAAVAFVVFAFAVNRNGPNTTPPSASSTAVQEGAQPYEGPLNRLSLDYYRRRLNPNYGKLQITENRPGSGVPVLCGQTVTIRYQGEAVTPDASLPMPGFSEQQAGAGAPEDKPSEEPETHEITFLLGDSEVPEPLRAAVLGMRKGAQRAVQVPSESTVDKRYPERYVITLLEVAPELPPVQGERIPPMVFDRETMLSSPLQCGETVQAHLRIWNAEGEKVVDSREAGAPLTLISGVTPLPRGIQAGLQDMPRKSTRTVIVPPGMLDIFPPPKEDSAVQSPEILRNFSPPKGQVLIVEIEAVS